MAAGPEGATGIGITSVRSERPGEGGASSIARSVSGSSSGAAARRLRSSGRCQRPWRPGRFPADGASNRIAPGRGHSSAAVVLEYRIAPAGATGAAPRLAAARAARAHIRSVSISVLTGAGGRARAILTLAPALRSVSASCSSAVLRPSVEPSETSRTSAPGAI